MPREHSAVEKPSQGLGLCYSTTPIPILLKLRGLENFAQISL